MNEKILGIKFHKLAVMLLPLALRKDRIIELLGVLTAPFMTLLGVLTSYRTERLQRLKYNGQTCRLEYCLNHRFGDKAHIDDPDYPDRIRVLDGTDSDGKPYIVHRRDVNALYDRPKRRGDPGQIILNRRYVNSQTFCDFYVKCPTRFLQGSGGKPDERKQKEFAAVVNTYKTQGKTWQLL